MHSTLKPIVPTPARAASALALAGLLLGGCAASGSIGGDVPAGDPAGSRSEPTGDAGTSGDPSGGGDPGPSGDGTDCGPCPGGDCRDGVCIVSDEDGAVCEFDGECPEGELCIGGHCSPDPRMPRTCTDSSECSGTMSCSMAGSCVCATTADCEVGLVCDGAGTCVPTPDGPSCVADDECASGEVCEAGTCIPGSECDVAHPDLSGEWTMSSELRLREILPGWLDGLLDAVAGPFRFLAGDSMELDLGLPGFIEDIAADALRDFAESRLTPWQRDLLGAIADLNDILSTWYVAEDMELRSTGTPDVYNGTHEWTSVELEYRGMRVRGRPEDIIDWRFEPEELEATAVCGYFNIHRHDIDVSIGSIIAWAVDTVVYESTDGRYATLDAALDAASAGFCDEAASAVSDAVDFTGSYTATRTWCTSELSRLAREMTDAIDEARIGADLMSLKGTAPIESATALRPGTWEGTLAGGDFTGDFEAVR